MAPTTNNYSLRRKGAGLVPWGYEPDPEDRMLLRPVVEQLDLMKKGFDYVEQGCSYRDVADWLSASTGRPCSYQTVRRYYERFKEGKF